MSIKSSSLKRTGVRYITEDYVRSISKEERLDRVRRLSINGNKNDKPIKYIENLNNLTNLQVLDISNNVIEKIEKLEKLHMLKELNISNNKITRLDGLDNLLQLKILNISGNQVSTIPNWFSRRCKYIMNINFSRNLFDSVEEISKLWNMKDLIHLNCTDNPVVEIPHYRHYIVMRLKYLISLDEIKVTEEEKQIAINKYENNELDRVSLKLSETEKQLEYLVKKQNEFEKDRNQQQKSEKKFQQNEKEQINRIKQLEEEVKSKEIQLKKKSDDLFRACNKYYELEQDIAFIKIDAKFDILSKDIESLEEPGYSSEQSVSGISGTGDQPYMGKGQFITPKEIEMLRERRKAREKRQGGDENNKNESFSARKIKEDFVESLDDRIREKMVQLEEVNKDLEDKNKCLMEVTGSIIENERLEYGVNSANTLIPKNGVMLERPKSALARSTGNNAKRASPLRSILIGGSGSNISKPRKLSFSDGGVVSDQMQLAEQFSQKFENLTDMQREAQELRLKMESTEKLAHRQREEVAYLRNELEKMKDADPMLANTIENEMKNKEMKMDENIKLYKKLSSRLDQLSGAIEASMNDIQELEQILQEENQYFTDNMRKKVNDALNQLDEIIKSNKMSQDRSYPHMDKVNQSIQTPNNSDYIQLLNKSIAEQQDEIMELRSQLNNLALPSDRKSYRSSIEDNVELLRNELKTLRHEAIEAKDDLESEIEMEKVLNEELSQEIEKLNEQKDHLHNQLQKLSNQHSETLHELKSDHSAMKQYLDQHISQLENDLIQHIEAIADNPAKIKNPTNKIEETLSKTIQNILDNQSPNTSESAVLIESLNNKIERLNDQIGKIKNHLSKEHVDPQMIPATTPQHLSFEQTEPIKNLLKGAHKTYQNELDDVKRKIYKLERSLSQLKRPKIRKEHLQQRKPSKVSYKMNGYDRSSDEITSDEQPNKYHRRSFSQDRLSKRAHMSEGLPKKSISVQQNISSDESALIDTMQDELLNLRDQINQSQLASSIKIKDAVDSIKGLERSISKENRGYNANGDFERTANDRLEDMKNLLAKVEQEKDYIENLVKNNFGQFQQTPSHIGGGGQDFGSLISIIQSQKAEIERLNGILERLLNDKGISAQPTTSAAFTFSQPPNPNISTTYTQTQFQPTNFQPPNQFAYFNPNQSAATQTFQPNPINSQSTPLLNNVSFMPNAPVSGNRFDGLFCNIPEHHYLEDYYSSQGENIRKQKMKQKIKTDIEKYMKTLDLLQIDINNKKEELDSVEIQVSKQSGEIERLHYQIEQMNMNKQDMLHELDLLHHEIETIKSEKLDSANKSLANLNYKKSSLNEDIIRTEGVLCSRREELSRVDSNLKNSSAKLDQVSYQTSETLKELDNIRSNHRQLVMECEELEKRSKEASMELSRALNQISDGQNEISQMTINKSHLESVVKRTQDLINQKDREFQNITDDILRAKNNLKDIESNLNIQSEQSKEKSKLISENERMLQDSRMELNKLKKEITLKHQEIDQLESETGEKSAVLEMIERDIDKAKHLRQRFSQEHQSEKISLKNEIDEMKAQLENLSEQKRENNFQMESMKSKVSSLKEAIEDQERIITNNQAEMDKRNWHIKNNDNIIRMKEEQLGKVQMEYEEKFQTYDKLHQEIYELQDQSKKLESEIKTKTADIERLKCISMTETEHLERMKFDKDNMESSLSNLKKEKVIFQNQNRELDDSLSMKKRQETNLQNSISNIESRLSDAHGDLEKVLNEKQSELVVQHEVKLQTDNLNKQLHAAKCELQSTRDRVTVLEAQQDEKTTDVRKKLQQYNKLNSDIRKMQDQLRLMNLSYDDINNNESTRKEKLKSIDTDISQKMDGLKELEKKYADVTSMISKEEMKLDRMKQDNLSEMAQLKSELADKTKMLESTGVKLNQLKKDAALKEYAEQKIVELEQIIEQQQEALDRYQYENRQLGTQLATISRDLTSAHDSHRMELEIRDKEASRSRKLVRKDINQLEQMAEEHCHRANSLAEELSRAKRDYLLLKNRCIAQERFIDQQNLLEEYLQPPLQSSHSNKRPNGVKDGLTTVESAINILRESLLSEIAANNNNKVVNDDERSRINVTTSSGLGSTLDGGTGGTGGVGGGGGTTTESFEINDLRQSNNGHVSDNSIHTYPNHDSTEQNATDPNIRFNSELVQIRSDLLHYDDFCRKIKSEVNNMKAQ